MDVLLVIILLLIVFFSGFYIYRAKKRGQTCIGCPYSGKCGGSCSCNDREDNKK